MDFLDQASEVSRHPSPSGSDIDFETELNQEQHEAVSSPPGPALVLAGAGSGKTRTLTYRVAWLLANGVSPDRILLLTFTNKAAREMLGRVEDLTGIDSRAFWGGTFHHVGQRILRQSGRPVGISPSFNIIDEGDADSLINETIRAVDPGFLKNKNHPKPRPIRHLISYARNTCLNLRELAEQQYPFFEDLPDKIDHFARAYREKRREQQVCDYDDLLEGWLELLRESPDAARYWSDRFDHILVDEYQDTNTLQCELIDRMGGHHQIMAVGDDAQCIYTWRGANFENIVTFPDRHPDTRIYKIETNYRSTPDILHFANGVLELQPATTGYEKALRPVREPGCSPSVIQTLDTRQQASVVIETITNAVRSGRSPNEIAVLYRAHYQAMELQLELARRDIPFQITSGLRFFEQAHIRDVAAQLRFLGNPRDTSAFFRFACLLPKIGPKTAERLYRFWVDLARKEKIDFFDAALHSKLLGKVPSAARPDWESMGQTLIDAKRIADGGGTPEEMVSQINEGWYSLYLRQTYPNWREREEDLKSLIGFARRQDSLTELLAQLILLSSETSDRSIDDRDPKVRLTTVHQAKGLEFPVVIVIGLAEGQFPINRAIDEGNLEEERRLFYVAVTRAMDELYLFYPKLTAHGGPPRLLGPSRFLSEIPENRYRFTKHRSHYW